MKVVRFMYEDTIKIGFVDIEEGVIYSGLECGNILIEDMKDLISNYHNITPEDFNFALSCPISEVTLLPPVIPTKNIICIGKNYIEHIKELDGNEEGIELARNNPVFFSKSLNSINGPYHNIPLHANITEALDYEVELAVVIGKKGTNISKEKALDYIFGYTVLNDVTSRDLQKKHQQWFKGKSLDGCCPIGPWIVTKEDIYDPNNLQIRSYVNGELRQDSNTNDMLHNVYQLIHIISQGMTLEPGDIIATGTPSGVGMGFKPPKVLKDGDVVKCEIEDIGFIENKVVR